MSLLPIERARQAKFPEGKKMTVEEVAKVVGPEFAEMNENPPEQVKKLREDMEESMGADDHEWDQGHESRKHKASDLLPIEKAAASWFDMFFKEKNIPSKVFDVTDRQGITHMIPNEAVIEAIKQTRGSEKAKIEETLRKIDFGNGDVNHYLAHLAKGLAEQYSGALRFASQEEAEKLEAEAEANEQQADADRAKADAAQMRQAARSTTYEITTRYNHDNERDVEAVFDHLLDDVDRSYTEGTADYGNTEVSIIRDDQGRDRGIEMTVSVSNWQDADDAKALATAIQKSLIRSGYRSSGLRRLASKVAAGGLYGYTKGTQRDVEASVRKAQRRAASVAKTLYAKDERSVDFLKAHAKRANSKTARLILSAMKNLGPRVASDKTAALGIEAVKPNLFYVSTDDGDTYGPYKEGAADDAVDALNENDVDAVVEKGSVVLKSILKPGQFQLGTPAELKRQRLASRLLPIERVAAKDSAKKEWSRKDRKRKDVKTKVRQDQKKDLAQRQREKVAGGLYGHPTKTARLALVACSDLRAYVGEVAYSLHSRRTAKYANMTGFLKEHGKTVKCAYSRMILSCYPDAPVSKTAGMPSDMVGEHLTNYDAARSQAGLSMSDEDEEAKEKEQRASDMRSAAFVPDSVGGWLEWADGTRTAAMKQMTTEDIERQIKSLEDIKRKMEAYEPYPSGPLAASIKGVFKQIDALKNELDRAKQQVGKKATTDRRG